MSSGLVHVKSQHQVADVFTKAFPGPVFGKFIVKLGMINNYSPTWRGYYDFIVNIALVNYN